jgi:hypothetical protein
MSAHRAWLGESRQKSLKESDAPQVKLTDILLKS